MKTKLTTIALLLLATGGLFASTLAATPGKMHQVSRVSLHSRSEDITHGTSLWFVRQTIGAPDQKLTPDLWQYHNFRGTGKGGDTGACTELVLYFVNGRVEDMYLADRKACALISKRITTGQPELIALATVPENRVMKEIASLK